MKTKFTIALFLFIATMSIKAQTDPVLDAFTKSHYFEKFVNYTSAIDALKPVYSADSYEINLRMGWLHYKVGLAKESMDYYTIASKLLPNSLEARIGYVYAALSIKETELVLAQYLKILEIAPLSSSINYHIGNVYYAKKDYVKADAHFKTVVDLYPFDYDGLLMYAWTSYRLGRIAQAKVLFNQVLMLSPGDKSALEGLSMMK